VGKILKKFNKEIEGCYKRPTPVPSQEGSQKEKPLQEGSLVESPLLREDQDG
jgi:hypothetical protein